MPTVINLTKHLLKLFKHTTHIWVPSHKHTPIHTNYDFAKLRNPKNPTKELIGHNIISLFIVSVIL